MLQWFSHFIPLDGTVTEQSFAHISLHIPFPKNSSSTHNCSSHFCEMDLAKDLATLHCFRT